MKNKLKSDWEKKYKKEVELEEKITNWARNTWGLGEEGCLSSSEAYEMLEEGIKFFSEQARQEGIEMAIKEIRKIVADYQRFKIDELGLEVKLCEFIEKSELKKKEGGKSDSTK